MISEENLKRYCNGDFTSIENYAEAIADTTQKWEIHHRLAFTEDGKFAYSMEDLIKKGWYYDRPSSELIFLTPFEHRSLHGKGRSDEHCEKSNKAISKALTGRKLTDEHRKNLCKARKGRIITDATREKLSKASSGPRKHFDITVSWKNDPKAYKREWYLKKKALAANK